MLAWEVSASIPCARLRVRGSRFRLATVTPARTQDSIRVLSPSGSSSPRIAWPSRNPAARSPSGARTHSRRSAPASSSAAPTMAAPASANASSGAFDSAPAPRSTRTSAPHARSRAIVSGTAATRRSPGALSFMTPIRTAVIGFHLPFQAARGWVCAGAAPGRWSALQPGRVDSDALEVLRGGADQLAAEVDQRPADRELVADLRDVALARLATGRAVAVQRVLPCAEHHVGPSLAVLFEQEHLRLPLPGVQHGDRLLDPHDAARRCAGLSGARSDRPRLTGRAR